MSKDQKFLICKHCGNMIGMLKDAGVKVVCCGEPMELLVANTVEASTEKHIPVVKQEGTTVSVEIGSVAHPMIPEHHIEWIYLETENGGQRKSLEVGKAAVAKFSLIEDEVVAVYEYCNLHGLWKTKIK